jgi:hypothetical protein
MISRLEILAELNIVDCDCGDCMWKRVDAFADALETGTLRVVNDGDLISGLHITALGKTYLRPPLPATSA